MALKPILLFNKPDVGGVKGKLRGGSPPIIHPGFDNQSDFFFPKINVLRQKFAEHIRLSESADGLTPEKVLVLEIAGDPQNLAKRLSKVEGFEFMTSVILERKYQDDQFYATDSHGARKPLTKIAYLTMSNKDGLDKLYAIWKKYKDNKTQEKGHAPLIHAFEQLKDIRFWDTKDRLANTFLLEDWQERISEAEEGDDYHIPFEIELWYRENPVDRQRAQERIERLIKKCGGHISYPYFHAGIHYHTLVGQLPISRVSDIIAAGSSSIELMRCDDIMFFRPMGQCNVTVPENEELLSLPGEVASAEDFGENLPVVALLDGVPLSNHEALRDRLIIDDPDEFDSLYRSPQEHMHGTAMASLILHGDLNHPEEGSLFRPLYVRPIMAPEREQRSGPRPEQIPSFVLPTDIVHRAVLRMKRGDANNGPTAPEVVIINFSIGDRARAFDVQMSPLARMLDWLAVTYNVLFVVSAGNNDQKIFLEGIREKELAELTQVQKEEHALRAIEKMRPVRRLYSPAESVNALTVGAVHADGYRDALAPNQIDLFVTPGLFSPLNPVTFGRNRSVKPEILMPGGRQTFLNKTFEAMKETMLDLNRSNRLGPGMKVALPSVNPGELSGYGFTSGTSNAAALATRRLAMLYETVRDMKEFSDDGALSKAPDAVILKALILHGAEQDELAKSVLERYFRTAENKAYFKSELTQFMGYGAVDERRIHACLDNQATLIYTGVIKHDEGQDYYLPLPASLSANTAKRRLIVTLAWHSPVDHLHPDYRDAQLWAAPVFGTINANNCDYYQHYTMSGTVFHEVRKGADAANFTSGDTMGIKVSCVSRKKDKKLSVPYALVVTLDAPGSELPIYEEIKQGLIIDAKQRIQN